MIPRFSLADGYSLSRILKGGWHLAGGHGAIDQEQAIRDMALFVEAGVTTFDCADIYTGVEELIGHFRRVYPSLAALTQVHTKIVPDLSRLQTLDRAYIERIIDRSLKRLGMERLDLVQFHWWDFSVARYVETAFELERLRRAGKIARIGATNFGTPQLHELIAAGVPVVSHQLQYSLLDDRPAASMVPYCRTHDIALLCYGTVAGGFLSRRWLGQAAPREDLANRSLIKYRLIIEDFGGWELFQELLAVLAQIAKRHGTDVASVAVRAILERPEVAGVIIGATSSAHLAGHAGLASLTLEPEDLAAIQAVTDRRRGPHGDVYALERDRTGQHGQIMNYELNAASGKDEAP